MKQYSIVMQNAILCYCEITLCYKNAYTHIVLYHSITVMSIPLILIVLSTNYFCLFLGSAIVVNFFVSRVGFHGHIFSYCLTTAMKPGVK